MTVQGALANLVSETTTTQGTAPKALLGPTPGHRSFRSQFADGATVLCVEQQVEKDGNDEVIAIYMEASYATLTYGDPDTLTPTAIVDSTNGGSAVDWGPGTKTVWCAAPGELIPLMDTALTAAKAGRPLIVNAASTGFTPGAPGLGQQAASELTVASGSVTPTRARHTIDTESDAATDDLTNAVTTNIPDGGLLMLSGADAGRVTTIKHAATGDGEFHMADAADFALAGSATILFERRGADWYEVSRSKRPVTVADMADLAQNKLIGRATASTGVPEAVGLDSTLAMAAGNLKVADASTSQRGSVSLLTASEIDTGTDAQKAATAAAIAGSKRTTKVWWYAQSDGTLFGSFGVSSFVRNSTGNYTVNFSTSAPSTIFGASAISPQNITAEVSRTASSFTYKTGAGASYNAIDASSTGMIVF